MSLEDLYDKAQPNTYVATVRDRQEASAPTNQTLVNFLDGQPRGTYRQGATPPQDVIQTEFTRNAERSYVRGGAQGIARGEGETLSRWTEKAFSIAFDGNGPSQLSNGFYTNQFRTAKGPSGQQTVHMYTPPTPSNRNTFIDKNSSARDKKNMTPSGAPPRI